MWFLLALTWLSTGLQFCFASLSIASGLYYLAELVEEYASIACKTIRYIILAVIGVYIGFMLFENFPIHMNLCGIAGQLAHLYVMKSFPYFNLTSPRFLASLVILLLNHYLSFSYFSEHYYPFMEVLAYFSLCLWTVPFAFFISLSANDYVLPTKDENRPLLGEENDVVSNYFSKKTKKRFNLLGMFKSTKDMVLPQRTKKSF